VHGFQPGGLLDPVASDDRAQPLIFRIGGYQAYGGWGVECAAPAGAYKDNEWCTWSARMTVGRYGQDLHQWRPAGEWQQQPQDRHCRSHGVLPGDERSGAAAVHRWSARDVRRQSGRSGDLDNALTAENVAKVYALGPLALDPRMASSPKPADGAKDVVREAVLEWKPGKDAVSHDVYLGTVFEDVNAAGTGSPLLRSPDKPPQRMILPAVSVLARSTTGASMRRARAR